MRGTLETLPAPASIGRPLRLIEGERCASIPLFREGLNRRPIAVEQAHDDEEQHYNRHDAGGRSGNAEPRGSPIPREPSRSVDHLGVEVPRGIGNLILGRRARRGEIGDDLIGSNLASCERDCPSFAALSRNRGGA
jgi:hypothetical protein